jgi:cell division FtsZ-interacting protein ZapD
MLRLELTTQNLDVNFTTTDEDDDLETLGNLKDFLEVLQYREHVNLVVKSREKVESFNLKKDESVDLDSEIS